MPTCFDKNNQKTSTFFFVSKVDTKPPLLCTVAPEERQVGAGSAHPHGRHSANREYLLRQRAGGYFTQAKASGGNRTTRRKTGDSQRKNNHKNGKVMGTAYKIKCKHCGTEFQHSTSPTFGLYQECVACGCSTHVETEKPIRCPSCLHILNRTPQEFNEQIETVMTWD